MNWGPLKMAGGVALGAGGAVLGQAIADRVMAGSPGRMAGQLPEEVPGETLNAPQAPPPSPAGVGLGAPAAFDPQDYLANRAYEALNADPEMTAEDRMTAALVLTGQLPPGGAGVKVGDTPGGRRAIELAGQLKKEDGVLAAQLGQVMLSEVGLM